MGRHISKYSCLEVVSPMILLSLQTQRLPMLTAVRCMCICLTMSELSAVSITTMHQLSRPMAHKCRSPVLDRSPLTRKICMYCVSTATAMVMAYRETEEATREREVQVWLEGVCIMSGDPESTGVTCRSAGRRKEKELINQTTTTV